MTNILTPIASQIETAVKDIPGWTPLDQLLSLFTLAFSSANTPGDILELGSWCGRSAVALGMAARLTGNTRLHCVDLFPEKEDWRQNTDGTYSFSVTTDGTQTNAYSEQTVWAEPYLRDIAPVYEKFTGTLSAFNYAMHSNRLENIVTPFKGNLSQFSESAPSDLKLRLAFIDGDHSYSAVSTDIANVEKFLIPGGWICFDDAFSSYDGVNEAIKTHIISSGRYQCCQQLTRKLFIAQLR